MKTATVISTETRPLTKTEIRNATVRHTLENMQPGHIRQVCGNLVYKLTFSRYIVGGETISIRWPTMSYDEAVRFCCEYDA